MYNTVYTVVAIVNSKWKISHARHNIIRVNEETAAPARHGVCAVEGWREEKRKE